MSARQHWIGWSLALAAALAACGDDEPKSTPQQQSTPTPGSGGASTILRNAELTAKEYAAHDALMRAKYDEALKLYDEILVLEPQNLSARVNRAVVLARLGRYPEALAVTEECLKVAPNDPEILINRASMLHDMQRSEEALVAIDQALVVTGEVTQPLMLKANVLIALARIDEAVATLDRAVELSPGQPMVMVQQAQTLDRIGRRADADPIWAALLQQFPQDAQLKAVYDARPAEAK